MRIPTRLTAGAAVTGIAVVAAAAVAAAPLTPVPQPHQRTVTQDVRLAADAVPIGGLVTSFLDNQVIYCSLICPLLVETALTPAVKTLQTPGAFLTALRSGNLLKAIGAAAASVTGPTNAAAEQAILVDSEIPAPRALNAFETGVVGLLNIIPAAPGGLPGIIAAIQTARQDTFNALNAPVVPNPPPTVMPQGVVQVAVVSTINVGAAVMFPAFNDFLSAAFETPNAMAQELAAKGNPAAAGAAGVSALGARVTAAVTVIADSVVTGISNIRAATPLSLTANQTTKVQKSATTTMSASAKPGQPRPVGTTRVKANAEASTSNALRDVASNLRHTAQSVTKKASQRPDQAASH
ncbi:MAG: hypothetical protein NVSMB60_31290 [Mycobacterium sp.]